MKLLSLLVVLLVVQAASAQILLSTVCSLLPICKSSVIASLGLTTSLTVDVAFTVDSALTLQTLQTSGNGAMTIVSGAALTVTQGFTAAASTTVQVAGSLVVAGSATVAGNVTIANTGSASFQSNLAVQEAATLAVSGTAVVNGTVNIAEDAFVNVANSAYIYASSSVSSAGNVSVSGTFSASTYTQTDGYLILGNTAQSSSGVNSSVTIASSATLCGTGNINGNLEVDGTIAPGNSPGTSYVNGDVRFSSLSVYKFEVDNDNNKHDLIIASGTAYMAGYVKCHFINSAPASTTEYTALTYSNRQGSFSNFAGDVLYLLAWTKDDNTAFSTQFVFHRNGASTVAASFIVVAFAVVASLL